MPVNDTLATYSDWTFAAAGLIYFVALMFALVEQAFGTRSRAKVARELVGAGAPAEPVDAPVEPGRADRAERADRFGRMSVALVVLGALSHLGSIVLRGFATGRAPWGNMYEYGAAVCLVAVVTWLVLLSRYDIRRLTPFVLLPVVFLMFIGGTILYTDAAPVQPALRSYWLVIHVSAAIIASGVLLVPGVASVMYLMKTSPRRFATLRDRLPAAETLDRLAYRSTVFAFPIFTFGVIAGAIWAEAAWGRFWGWDPKETVAFVAWIVYAAYLHARATAGWRGRQAAAINAFGFGVMIFNLFFINLVTAGLHSYANG